MNANNANQAWIGSVIMALLFSVGCASVQNLSEDKLASRKQLATLCITSGKIGDGQTTVASIDGHSVDSSKKRVMIDPGLHAVAIHFYKEIEPPGPKIRLTLSTRLHKYDDVLLLPL